MQTSTTFLIRRFCSGHYVMRQYPQMSSESERRELYSEVTLCPLQCAGISNDRRAGIIPRSFYWGGTSPYVNLLVVSKNPGHAPDWERNLYARTSPEDITDVHLQVVRDLFDGARSVPSSYHVNLVRRVAAVLGVEANATEVFKRAAMTALAKCQSAGPKTAKIPRHTYSACAERYLLREIAHFKPVYLLALGTEVFDFLTSAPVASRHGLRVGKLWHPSWSNMPGGEAAYFAQEIPALRREYIGALQTSGRVGADCTRKISS